MKIRSKQADPRSAGSCGSISFYPAHHITSGEGGCVLTGNLLLSRVVESLRDWGRDCWCLPGESDACLKRFKQQAGELAYGYDHKCVYSHIGYNLKATDLQAALGLSQLTRLAEFGAARRKNWQRLRDGLDGIPWLLLPSATPGNDPSWFGFPLTIEAEAPFERREIIEFLESRRIGTRLLLAGNLARQPAYQRTSFRISGDLANSDIVAEKSFWVGVYPGITDEMTGYIIESISHFVQRYS